MEHLEGTIEGLRAAHKEAVEAGHATFKYRGQELVTDYAKYMLEHEDMKNKDKDEH